MDKYMEHILKDIDTTQAEELVQQGKQLSDYLYKMENPSDLNLKNANEGIAQVLGGMTWTLADQHIVVRLNQLVHQSTLKLIDTSPYPSVATGDQTHDEQFTPELSEVGKQIHDFIWSELADWYIEV